MQQKIYYQKHHHFYKVYNIIIKIDFDPKNYEHVMVLGKLNKMIDKFKI